MRWIGIDVHQLFLQVAELNEDGLVKHYRVAMNEDGLAKLIQHLGPDSSVVMEASTQSFSLYDELVHHAHRVAVCNPAHARGASALHVKTDLRDAEILARLLATDFIRPVWVPEPHVRALRRLMEHRWTLRSQLTAMVNRLHASFRGEFLEYRKTVSRSGRLLVEQLWKDPHQELVVRTTERLALSLREQLREIDVTLEEWSAATPEAALLRTIPGVGPVLAATFLSVIGDVRRFETSAALCAYAGLVPTVHASGKTLRIGKLCRGGRSLMRWGTWIAVLSLVRLDGHFQEFHARLRTRRPGKIALVACCRKLLTVIWHMLRTGQSFRKQPVVKKSEV